MGLLSNGNITLVDLTDSRSATLYLSTSLSRTQVESEGSYQPDYSLGDGQVITPSLYFGQDKEDNFKISYFINNNEIISEEGSIYVKNKNLYIKENLTENKLITAIVKDITDSSTGILYNQIESQIELVKVSNPKENFFPLIEYDRTVFSNERPENITLKAVLYKGGTPYTNGVSYKWMTSSTVLEEDGSTLSVTRDDVINVTSFQCEMSIGEDSNASTYSASVTLTDWTDPLSSQIISNKGVYLQNIDDKIGLTCNIFRKNLKINEDNSNEEISYEWSYSTDGKNFPVLEEEKEKEIEIDINQFKGFSSVYFQCKALVKKTGTNEQFEETSAQITIAISPAYRVEITPRNILISCDKDGNIKSEEDNFVKNITFKLLDLDGNILARSTGDGVGDISFFDKVITAEPKEIEEREGDWWDYNIKLESSKDKILENNYLINIPYTYFGFQDSDEIYLIKNIQGEQGVQGEQGESVSILHIKYAVSKTKIESPSSSDLDWNPDYPTDLKKGDYLYTETTFSDGSKIYTESYQGTDGAELLLNYRYAISENGSQAPDEEEEWESFMPDVTEQKGKFLWTEITTSYSDNSKEPTITYSVSYISTDGIPGEKIISIVPEYCLSRSNDNKNKPDDSDNWVPQVPNDFIDDDGNILYLWCRYKMTYKDENIEYSEPELAENIKDLNITMADAKLLIDNKSIQLVAAEAKYEDGDLEKIKTASLSVLAGQILFETERGKYSSYMSFEPEGLTIGSTESDYYSQILNSAEEDYFRAGFYIKYNDLIENENGEKITVQKNAGFFNSNILKTKALSFELGEDNDDIDIVGEMVITKTLTGGIAFGYLE